MRDLIIFAVVFGMLPFCLMRPFFGLLVWSWLGYMNPHRLAWGAAYDFPFVQLVAVTTLLGLLFSYFRRGPAPKMQWQRESILLVMLCVMFVISTIFALRPDLAWPELEEIGKIVLMAFITILLVDDEKKLRLLLLVIAGSIGFYGLKGGIFSLASGGVNRVYGPMESSLADNTAIALGLNMILPLLYFLARSESRRAFRNFLYSVFFFSILAVLFTYSRGGFLGLAVVLSVISLSLKTRNKVIALILILLTFPIAIQQMPGQIVDRVNTIQGYEADGSAQARFGAWRTAWAIGLGRPLTGGGFQIVDDVEIGRQFNPTFDKSQVGAHSIYFEILAENGFIALGIFLFLVVSTIMSARKIRKTAARYGISDFFCYGYMLEAAILAYAVSGAFLEFASFDLFYQYVAIIVVAKVLFRKRLEALETEATEAPIKRPFS